MEVGGGTEESTWNDEWRWVEGHEERPWNDEWRWVEGQRRARGMMNGGEWRDRGEPVE